MGGEGPKAENPGLCGQNERPYKYSMFGLSLGHLIILLVVVLLFGSRKLPELGSALGRGIHAFKKGIEGKDDDKDKDDDQKKLS